MALGNRLQYWERAEDIPSDFSGLVMVRALTSKDHGGASPVLTPAQVRARSWNPKEFRFNECAPDDRATLQGYVRNFSGTLHLDAWIRKPGKRYAKGYRMKEVLRWFRHYEDLQARLILKEHLCLADFEDLEQMLFLFPAHVVELTAYSCDVGWARGRNTIFWELRNY